MKIHNIVRPIHTLIHRNAHYAKNVESGALVSSSPHSLVLFTVIYGSTSISIKCCEILQNLRCKHM